MKSESKLRLSEVTLPQLKNDVLRPSYTRGSLLPHTVHMGVGGFHRAHQAVYLDDLLGLGEVQNWGECGIGLMPNDIAMRDALAGQDFLYTVLERSAHKLQARVIGSMIDCLYAPHDPAAAIERIASADTKLVSLTITEGGYFIHDATGTFSVENADIQHDVRNPGRPTTSLGYLTAALKLRRDRGLGPLTLMSCDNLQGNGHALRKVVLGLAEQQDTTLHRWIADYVAFPNSMVDRITPATTDSDREFLESTYGLIDAWPVVTEPFRQWVIEDEFCSERPPWERVGAQLVADVAPYELMKMRLLNGSHMALAYLAALAGIAYAHEVMQDEAFFAFVGAFMDEVTPVVPQIVGTSIAEYKSTLIERFSNPTIKDQVARLCSEGSAKLPKWIFPSIAELGAKGHSVEMLSLAVAGWVRYLQVDEDERGNTITVVDAKAAQLKRMARACGGDVRPFLATASIFGEDMIHLPGFADKVQTAFASLRKAGTSATLHKALHTRMLQGR